jgi:WD40 repeat protein
VRKTLVAIARLLLIASPSLIGFLVLWALTPKAVVYHAPQYVCRAEISPDGKTIATTHHDNTITLIDVTSRHPRATLRGHTAHVQQVAYSPDSSAITTASYDNTVKIWNSATGQEQRTLRGHQGGVFRAMFTPDGRSILSSGEDKTIRLWDGRSGETIATFYGHTDSVRELALSPDGTRLASSDGKALKLWDLADRDAPVTLSTETWQHLVFCPDGRTLAAVGDEPKGRLGVWAVGSGAEQHIDDPLNVYNRLINSDINSLQFSPDGKQLVLSRRVSNWDDEDEVSAARIDIWDVARRTHSDGVRIRSTPRTSILATGCGTTTNLT